VKQQTLRELFTVAFNGYSWQTPLELRGKRGPNGAGFITWLKRQDLLAQAIASDKALAQAFGEWKEWRKTIEAERADEKASENERAYAGLLRHCSVLVRNGIKVRTIVRYISEHLA